MKTSYFRASADTPGAVSIARKRPWYFDGPEYRILFPPEYLLRDYGDGLVPWAEYEDRYYCEVLGPLDAQRVYEELCDLAAPHEPILLCWERTCESARCHRRLVASWLEKQLNVEVPEIELDGAAAGRTKTAPLFGK